MDEKQKILFLKKLVDRKTVSQVEKSDLKIIAVELGVEVQNSGCKDCWKDTAVTCYNILVAKNAPSSKRKYVLRGNVDVIFNGERINASTITDEKAAKILKANFPKRFFVKMPDDEI